MIRGKNLDLSQKELEDMMFNDTLNLDQIKELAKALQEEETENN